MFGKNKNLNMGHDKPIKLAAFAVSGLLLIGFIFVLLNRYDYADYMLALVYFGLLLMVGLRVLQYRSNPQVFSAADEPEKLDLLAGTRKFFSKPLGSRHGRLQKLFNTFILVFFFLFYGVSSPSQSGFWVFIILVVLLVAANIYIFYYIDTKQPKETFLHKLELNKALQLGKVKNGKLANRLDEFFSERENVMITIINGCFLAVFLVLFGVDLGSYLKFFGIIFFLIFLNIILFADVRNGKLYE